MELGKSEEGYTPVFLAKSAQAVGNKRDDLPWTAKERGKSAQSIEKIEDEQCTVSQV